MDGHIWDLSALLQAPPADTVASAQVLARSLGERYRGRVAQLPVDEIAELTVALHEACAAAGHGWKAAELAAAADVSDDARVATLERCRSGREQVEVELQFVERELAAMTPEQRDRWLSSAHPATRTELRGRVRRAGRLLSPMDEEELAGQRAEVETGRTAAWDRRFAQARIRHDGSSITLYELDGFYDEPDRAARHRGFAAGAAELAELAPAFAEDLATAIRSRHTEDRRRGRQDPRLRRLEDEGLELEEVDALHRAVLGRMDQSRRWWAGEAVRSGLQPFTYADRYVVDGPAWTTPALQADAALDACVASFGALHPEIASAIETLRQGPSLDLSTRPGKRQDPFCDYLAGPVPSWVSVPYDPAHPSSAGVLAHELGHAVHGLLAAPGGWFGLRIPGAVGETMAMLSELMLLEHLGADDRVLLERLLGGIHRQAAATEYELRLHACAAAGRLGLEDIRAGWLDAIGDTLGDAVDLTGYQDHWILTPHAMSYPLFTHSYVYGGLLASRLLQEVRRDPAVGGVIAEMMRVGGLRSPREVAAIAGLDTTDPAGWRAALDALDVRLDRVGAPARA